MSQISFTPALAAQLKWHYNRAVEQELDTFMFAGGEWVVDYAKYMIEFLESNFGELDPQPPAGVN